MASLELAPLRSVAASALALRSRPSLGNMTPGNKNVWVQPPSLDEMNALATETMIERLGISFTDFGADYLEGTMPVDDRTKQPYGLLHGGASVAFAETLGSMAANLCVDQERHMCVGLDVSTNHVRSVTEGVVTGTARPLHLGSRTHVWEITVRNGEGALVSVSRLTLLVVERTSSAE